MANGVSIHIGLNRVDPAGYGGWSGVLAGCENDALAMQKIADRCGYSSQKLLTSAATSLAVCEAIGQAAQDLVSGDYLLLTYSGHGGQVPDTNGDEDDGQDETWVLYDRMLVDDELYSLWSQFAAGVRIFVLSDSCHSGTVVRMVIQNIQNKSRSPVASLKLDYYDALASMSKGTKAIGFPQTTPRYKHVPGDIQAKTWQDHEALYRTAQWVAGRPKDHDVNASVVLISGCQDNQLSMDGDQNGLFTEKLLKTWSDGAFEGGHYAFYDAIKNLMPPSQTPNYYTTGATDSAFEDAKPFVMDEKVSGAAATTSSSTTAGAQDAGSPEAGATPPAAPGKPSVAGPDSASQDQAPSFTVDLAGNPYFIFEIADSESLLDSPPANGAHYYGTWADPNERARLTDTNYRILDAAWAALSSASTLYYRVSTTSSSSPDKWEDYEMSDVQSLEVTPTKAKRSAPPAVITKAVVRRGMGRRDAM